MEVAYERICISNYSSNEEWLLGSRFWTKIQEVLRVTIFHPIKSYHDKHNKHNTTRSKHIRRVWNYGLPCITEGHYLN